MLLAENKLVVVGIGELSGENLGEYDRERKNVAAVIVLGADGVENFRTEPLPSRKSVKR
jgi:hypothetical protein